jgi:hypothetical protein
LNKSHLKKLPPDIFNLKKKIMSNKHQFLKKTCSFVLGFFIVSVLFFMAGCGNSADCKLTAEDTAAICSTCPGQEAGITQAATAGLPNNAFYCLRAGQDTVERWLDNAAGGGPYARIVFNYYWPNRTQNGFTLMAIRGREKGTRYTLKKITVCAVEGIGESIILADQQVSRETIRRVWSRHQATTDYLKFIPMVNLGEEPAGNACNCPNHLIYKIQLVNRFGQPYGADDPGYTNPSPPKPPAD